MQNYKAIKHWKILHAALCEGILKARKLTPKLCPLFKVATTLTATLFSFRTITFTDAIKIHK